jgi:hypothetical protein
MSDSRLYAVITGDMVRSSRLGSDAFRNMVESLKNVLKLTQETWTPVVGASFVNYRGDGFQGVVSNAGEALRVVLWIRCGLLQMDLRHDSTSGSQRIRPDARIAIGLGEVDTVSPATEGHGEAFTNSGLTLETMKSDERMRFKTPWHILDDELNTNCSLVDALMNRWSSEQAQAIAGMLEGQNQQKIAKTLGISQPAVNKRLKQAGGVAIERFCRRYATLVSSAVSESV